MVKKLVVGVASAALAGAVLAAPALSAPRLWTDATLKTPLREVKSVPLNQPDALEWANNGSVLIILQSSKEPPIMCNEVEFGTTVVTNLPEGEPKLALPFGVAEGDNCTQDRAGGLIDVPTYFDTNAAGAVPATITLAPGPPLTATIHKLKLSQDKEGKFCTTTVENVKGEVHNVVEGFVEESPPNLNVSFREAPVTVTCGKEKIPAFLSADFFVETMSTTTDTAFVG